MRLASHAVVLDRFARGDGTYYAKMVGLAEHPEETAAEIEILEPETALMELDVDARDFLGCLLEHLDVADLAADVAVQQLEPVGITVDLQGLEPGVFYDQLNEGDFDATVVGWMGFVDPDEYLYQLFHSDGQYNQQGYSNAEVDRLLEQGRQIYERTGRAEVYAEAQRIIAREAPMVFLYVNPQISAMRPDVQDYVVHPTATTIFLRRTHRAAP